METPRINSGAFEPVTMDGFARGWEHGQKQAEERAARSAMQALLANPDDPKAIQAYGMHDPKGALDLQRQRKQDHLKELDAHRDSIKIGAQIIRAFGVKDEQTYQAAKAYAAQNGIDISQLPPNFDAQYIQNITHLADALDPESVQRPQLVPFTEGGGVARMNPQTNQVEVVVQPNAGGHQPGSPVAQPLSDEEMMRLRGGQGPQGPGGF